jgi:hypothetical protein
MMQKDILRIYDGKYLFNKNKFYFKSLGIQLFENILGGKNDGWKD